MLTKKSMRHCSVYASTLPEVYLLNKIELQLLNSTELYYSGSLLMAYEEYVKTYKSYVLYCQC